MEVLHVNLTNINSLKLPNLVSTIGQFDGLHLGHMALINKCLEFKKEKKALISFSPRVDVILKKDSSNNYLLDDEIFIKKVKDLGFDYLIIIDFSLDIVLLEHQDFIKQLLIPLNIKYLIVGFDFTYGRKAQGNINTLNKDANGNFQVIIIDEQKIDNKKIGSNQIKTLLKKGKILKANNLLGYEFSTICTLNENKLYAANLVLLKDQIYTVLINNEIYQLSKKENYLIINDNLSFEKNKYLVTFINN